MFFWESPNMTQNRFPERCGTHPQLFDVEFSWNLWILPNSIWKSKSQILSQNISTASAYFPNMIIRQHTLKDVNSIEVMPNSFQLKMKHQKKKKLKKDDICSKIVLLVIVYIDWNDQ